MTPDEPHRPARILLVEEQALVAVAIRQALEPRHDVLPPVFGWKALLAELDGGPPDAVIANLDLVTLQQLDEVRRRFPELRLAGYGRDNDADSARAAFRAGLDAFLWTGSEPAEFSQATEQILLGQAYLTPTATRSLADRWRSTAPASLPDLGTDIRVLIVDDHPMIRSGTEALLDAPGFEVVGTAENGALAVSMAAEMAPDVVLMDIMMPELNGVEASRAILEAHHRTKILLMSGLAAEELILKAVRAGASGYLPKRLDPEEMRSAVRAVHRGETFLSREITQGLMDRLEARPVEEVLTGREEEIARLVATGLANQQIAEKLFVSEGTVRTHLRHAFEKLGVSNRVELALYALRVGLATLDD